MNDAMHEKMTEWKENQKAEYNKKHDTGGNAGKGSPNITHSHSQSESRC